MGLRSERLSLELRGAASYTRASGDVMSDHFSSAVAFADRVGRVGAAVEADERNPNDWLRGFNARKWAKDTWCAPTCDLDDYLAGHSTSRGDHLVGALLQSPKWSECTRSLHLLLKC